ncbi:MAG: inositol monophosphatase [Isosphaeraceae bacterium]
MKSESLELSVAREAVRIGGEVVSRYFREGTTMRSKDVSNLVSDADVEAERAVVDILRQAFPGHEILAEEEHQGHAGAEHLWIVDPLDGTNNFAHGVPQFAVSVAYYRAGQPRCGVILNPVRDEWHVAERGRGATFNGQPVHVNDESRLNETLVGVGFYYDHGNVMRATLDALGELKGEHHIHGSRRFGAATLDLCMVGLGMFGAYFEYTLSPWDFAAGRLFVEEAGGKVTDCRGKPLPLERSSVLATNGKLHDAMLKVVTPRHP